MANILCIDSVYKEDSLLYGYHAYDEYDEASAFNWEKLPENDLDWLYQILTHENGYPDILEEMIQSARECGKGLMIRGNYYEHGQLNDIWNKAKYANMS